MTDNFAEAIQAETQWTVVRRTCPFCTKSFEVTVQTEDLKAWLEKKKYVQEAFPYLTTDGRELIQSGICPDDFDRISQ